MEDESKLITGKLDVFGQEFNIDVMHKICSAEEDQFKKLHNAQIMKNAYGAEAIYVDNGSNILAVAHLDKSAYSKPRNFFECYYAFIKADPQRKIFPAVFNGNLDDRLGVYLILHHLPKFLGVKFDWLFTTDEEVGMSTADAFEIPEGKDYNWFVEFDRRGTDVVLYTYDDTDFRDIIAKYAVVGTGSVSDISYLDHLGVKASNWGVGYHHEHSHDHYANLEETADMVFRFAKFYLDYKDTKLPHVYQPPKRVNNSNYIYTYRDDRYEDYDFWKNSNATSATSGTSVSRTASTEVPCESCGNPTFGVVFDASNDTFKRLCGHCSEEFFARKRRQQTARQNSTKHHSMRCENCFKVHPILYLNEERIELCFHCFCGIKVYKCKQCFADVEKVFNLNGVEVCETCLNDYMSLERKDNAKQQPTSDSKQLPAG